MILSFFLPEANFLSEFINLVNHTTETVMARGAKDIKADFLWWEAQSCCWWLNMINVIIRAQEYPDLLKKFQGRGLGPPGQTSHLQVPLTQVQPASPNTKATTEGWVWFRESENDGEQRGRPARETVNLSICDSFSVHTVTHVHYSHNSKRLISMTYRILFT